MQEDAEQYFLSTKARFQDSEDEENAAELYFATHNLVSHGHEVDWDSSLQKMEAVLKARDPGALLEIRSEIEAIAQALSTGQAQAVRRVPPIERGRDPPRVGPRVARTKFHLSPDGRGFKEGGTMTMTDLRHRKDSSPPRQIDLPPLFDGPAATFWMKYIKDGLLKKDWHDYGSMGDSSTLRYVVPEDDHDAEYTMEQIIREIMSAIPNNPDTGKSDPASMMKLHHENCEHYDYLDNPVTYKLLKAYYHPTSKNHVRHGDKKLDDHEATILDRASPHESVVDRLEEMGKKKQMSLMDTIQQEMGYLGPRMHGLNVTQARNRMYEGAFEKWDSWYKERFPNSPLLVLGQENEQLRRELFVEYCALRNDGCTPEYIEDVLYDDDGDLLGGKSYNYRALRKSEEYSQPGNRDPSEALGTLPWLLGLEMLDKDPRKHVFGGSEEDDKRCVEEKMKAMMIFFWSIQEDIWENTGMKLKPEHKYGYDEKHFPVAGNYPNIVSGVMPTFTGFKTSDLLSLMKRNMTANFSAVDNFFTGDDSTPHPNNRPELVSDKSDAWRTTFGRALKEAHKVRRKDEKTGRTIMRDKPHAPGEQPIYNKIRSVYGDDWDDRDGIPNIDMNGISDVTSIINKWLDDDTLTVGEAAALHRFIDSEHHGEEAETKLFAVQRQKNLRDIQHLVAPFEMTKEGDFNVENPETTYGLNAYGPTFLLLGRHGLGHHQGESIHMLGQWLGHALFMPNTEETMELSDMPPRYIPCTKCKGLPDKSGCGLCNGSGKVDMLDKNTKIGKEVHLAESYGLDPQDIKGNDRFPNLSHYIRRMEGEGVKEDNPVTLESLARFAWRAYWGAITAFPDENVPDIPHTAGESMHGANRALMTPTEFELESIGEHGTDRSNYRRVGSTEGDAYGWTPITGSVASLVPTMMSSGLARQMLSLKHIGWTTERIQRFLDPTKQIKLPKRDQKYLETTVARNSRVMEIANAYNLGGAVPSQKIGATSLFSQHMMGAYSPMEAVTLAAIHRLGGRGTMSYSPGNSFTNKITAASATTGTRDRASQRSNEMLSRDLQSRFRAMLWGEGGTTPLKYSDGELVVENPARFYDLLKKMHDRKGDDLTDVFREHPGLLESHPLITDSLRDFWPLIVGKSKVGNEFVQSQGLRGHWRDSIADSVYYWPLEQDENGVYSLPLEAIGKTKKWEHTEGEGRVMHVPSNQTGATPAARSVKQLRQRGKSVTGGEIKAFDLHSIHLEESWPGEGEERARVPPEQNAERHLFSDRIRGIPPENVVLVQGRPMMVGPHPSELMAQWAEEVLDRVPKNDDVNSLRGMLLDRAEWEVKDHPDYSGDTPERQPDERYNSGLTIDAIQQVTGAESNLFHFTRAMQPIIIAANAFRQIEINPDYKDFTSYDAIEKYVHDNLTLQDGASEEKRHQVFYEWDRIRSSPTKIINHLDSSTLEKYINYYINRCDEKMRPDAENHVENVLRPALESFTDYPVRMTTRVNNPAGDYSHPLNLEGLASGVGSEDEPWARRVQGYQVLYRYIQAHPEVRKLISNMGREPHNVAGDVIEHTEMPAIIDTKISDNFVENARDIQKVSHHERDKEPLHWFPVKEESKERRIKEGSKAHQGWTHKGLCSKCGPAMKAGNPASSDCKECGGGGNVTRKVTGWRDVGEKVFIPLKEQAAMRRGVNAQKSLNARKLFSNLLASPKTAQRLRGELGFLFRKGFDNGDSIMDIIRSDLSSIRDSRGNLSFPELHHAITPTNRLHEYSDLSESEQFRLLADFLFCETRTKSQQDQIKVQKPGGSSSPTKKLTLGGTSFTPVDSSEDPTRFGDTNMGDEVKFGGTFLPTTFSSTKRRDYYGVPAKGLTRHGWMTMRIGEWPELDTGINSRLQILHPDMTNALWGHADKIDQRTEPNIEDIDAARSNETFMTGLTTLDALTDTDLLYKGEKDRDEGKPLPIKAMHRIFKLGDLDHLRGFSDDWVVSSWPEGERIIVTKKKDRITAYDYRNESVTLPNKVKEGLKDASKKTFIIDCLWDKEVVHIVDILRAGDEDMTESPTKDRNRHLRSNFSATEEVSIPAPINTKRVDSEGLKRSVDDLMAESGVKQILLRDAQATYMKGENRHPKWVLLTPEYQVDVIIVSSRSGSHRLGIGPILEDDALELGNRAVKFESEYYMDVGRLSHKDLEKGKYVTLTISGVTSRNRKNFKVYTLQSPRYLKDSESGATDSVDSLDILCGKKKKNVPHKLRVNKGTINIEFPIGHVVYETEQSGNAFVIKDSDAPSDYLLKLAESQSEYWEPLAAILLRSEKESEKEAVVPEPPANHDKKPKKVLKPAERLLKDPEVVKAVVVALEVVENMLKEKITWTGPKALGIDYATPVESPSGPTKITEPYDMPDHDPAARQKEPKACWCGAERGEECAQGMGHNMENCPQAHPPKKEKRSKHIKVSRNS